MVCCLCERDIDRRLMEGHHLIPKTRHKNKRNKRKHSREEVKKTVDCCVPCHDHVHAVLTEKELEREFNTVEKLAEHPEIQKFIAWIKSKPADFVAPSRQTRQRKGR
jgi:hypothetical protein